MRTVSRTVLTGSSQWIAYRVGTMTVDKDESSSELFMVNWEGSTCIQLTHTEDRSEKHPRFSPDGRYLAFVAARGAGNSEESDDPKGKNQVWPPNRSGGEAQRLTELPGGVSSFEWSPDSTRLVLVSRDPEEKQGEHECESTDEDNNSSSPTIVSRR